MEPERESPRSGTPFSGRLPRRPGGEKIPLPFYAQRPLAAAALAYGAGIGAGAYFDWRPGIYLLCLGMALAVPPLLKRMGRRIAPGCMLIFLLLGMLAGGSAAHPVLPAAGRYRVRGVLWEDAKAREDGTVAAYLTGAEITDAAGQTHPVSKLYWTYTPADPDLPLPLDGQEVVFTANLYHPSGRQNPYGFDFRMFLLQQGVPAGVSGAADLQITGNPGRGAASFFYALRRRWTARLDAVFGGDSALPKAMLLGERESLPDDVRRQFTDAGVAHILSISGMHVTLLAASLEFFLKKCLSSGKRTILLGGFLLCYCALLGFPASVVRASLMMMTEQARRLLRRPPDLLTSLAFAFLLILAFHPLALFSVGFQLSFCAVLGISAWSAALRGKLSFLPARWMRDGAAVTISATAGTFLPCAQCFHRISLIGVFINPVVCAVFSLLLPGFFAAAVLGMLFLPLGQCLAAVLNPLSRAVLAVIAWCGDLPAATVRVPQLPWYAALAVLAACVLSTRIITLPGRRKAGLALFLLLASGGVWRASQCEDLQYLQLAMGQADAALVLDGEKTMLIDVGEYGGDVASYLLATGRNADVVFISHLHSDHWMGMRELLEQRIPIGQIYLPVGAEEQKIDESCLHLLETLRQEGVPIHTLAAGDTMRMGRVEIQVLWPERQAVRAGQDANDYCLAMEWNLDGVTLMTAGDLTGNFETYAARQADILKVAHHGSNSGTGEAYLALVSPQTALITGRGGNAVLPHADTLSRLARQGVSVYNTGEWGALTIRIREGRAAITPYLAFETAEEE